MNFHLSQVQHLFLQHLRNLSIKAKLSQRSDNIIAKIPTETGHKYIRYLAKNKEEFAKHTFLSNKNERFSEVDTTNMMGK